MTIKLTPVTAGTTLGGLKTKMGQVFDNLSTNFKARVEFCAGEVYREMMTYHKWSWLHQSSTITTQAGLAEYSVEANTAWIAGPMWIDGTQQVKRVSLQELRRWQGTLATSSRPSMYAVLARRLVVFYPTPSAAYTIGYDYDIQYGDLVSDDEQPSIPVTDQWVWIAGVYAMLRSMDNRFDAGTQEASGRYRAGLQSLVMRELEGEDSRRVLDDYPVI